MANKRLSMRKIKDVLRLHFEKGLGFRQISRSLNISHEESRDRRIMLESPLPSC